jgi:hypothetical protein
LENTETKIFADIDGNLYNWVYIKPVSRFFCAQWRSIIFLLHKNNINRIPSGLTKAVDPITEVMEYDKIRNIPSYNNATQDLQRLGIDGRMSDTKMDPKETKWLGANLSGPG